MNVLITGATDGLGLALAGVYESKGARVFAVGRRPYADLDRAPYPSDRYIQVDLARTDADRLLIRALNTLGIDLLDRVIHNAGTGEYGLPERQTEKGLHDLINLNFVAPIRITLRLADRVAAAKGKFVFIGSVAASLPCRKYAVYAATKRGLEGFARNLRLEAAKRYAVQVIHPGATKTAFHRKLGIPLSEMNWEAFPDAARTARQIVRAIESPSPVITIGIGNRILSLLARNFPQTFDRLVGQRTS